MEHYDALSLFSGGLDSILASKLMQSLGYKVLGLHFVSPFFGKPSNKKAWEEEYGIPLRMIDVGQDFALLQPRRFPVWSAAAKLRNRRARHKDKPHTFAIPACARNTEAFLERLQGKPEAHARNWAVSVVELLLRRPADIAFVLRGVRLATVQVFDQVAFVCAILVDR